MFNSQFDAEISILKILNSGSSECKQIHQIESTVRAGFWHNICIWRQIFTGAGFRLQYTALYYIEQCIPHCSRKPAPVKN